MSDNRFIKLTDTRRMALELAESEGAISADDVARAVVRGRNKRSAIKVLKDLHGLSLLTEVVRGCEYRLSDAGQAWLDSRRDDPARTSEGR